MRGYFIFCLGDGGEIGKMERIDEEKILTWGSFLLCGKGLVKDTSTHFHLETSRILLIEDSKLDIRVN